MESYSPAGCRAGACRHAVARSIGRTFDVFRATAWRQAPALQVVVLSAAALFTGCAKSNPEAAAKSATVAAGKDEARYALTGEVLAVDTTKKTARVRHDEVKGFMPAMTMDFAVSAADADALKPGQRIRAELVPVKDGDFRLEKIWPGD